MPRKPATETEVAESDKKLVGLSVVEMSKNPPRTAEPITWVNRAEQIVDLPEGYTLEYFDGDAWYEVTEGRPDLKTLRGHHATGFPETYVRANESYVLLFPKPVQDFLFRISLKAH